MPSVSGLPLTVAQLQPIVTVTSVGIREFRDKASYYLTSDEVLAVKRHDKLVGFYINTSQVLAKRD